MKLLGKYNNGNYAVSIYNDGTKVRETDEDEFIPEFAECMDVCITKKCNVGCQFCYEGCTPAGKHAELDFNSEFFRSLHPYTEMALNGNDMDHPQMEELLRFLKGKGVIANITVNQRQLKDNFTLIKRLQFDGLVKGIGVSLVNADEELVMMMKSLDNTVLHTICGILSKKDIDVLKNNGLKILLLGYKDLRRGHDYKEKHGDEITGNTMYLKTVLPKMEEWFDVVSFDNLAIEQLHVDRMMTREEWNEFYMGDDGQFTFYVDLVDRQYSRNSLSVERFDIDNLSVDEMFERIRKK